MIRKFLSSEINLSKLKSISELLTFQSTFNSIGIYSSRINISYLVNYFLSNVLDSQTNFFDHYCNEKVNGGVSDLLALRNKSRQFIIRQKSNDDNSEEKKIILQLDNSLRLTLASQLSAERLFISLIRTNSLDDESTQVKYFFNC